jgi:hypothetical protein
MMNLSQAIDIVVARTGHERFRELTDPAHPAYDPAYAPWIMAQAGASPEGPGLLRKAANLAGAVVEHVRAGLPTADAETAAARLATCRGCDKFDAARMACNLCGCQMAVKVTWLEQKCPIEKW